MSPVPFYRARVIDFRAKAKRGNFCVKIEGGLERMREVGERERERERERKRALFTTVLSPVLFHVHCPVSWLVLHMQHANMLCVCVCKQKQHAVCVCVQALGPAFLSPVRQHRANRCIGIPHTQKAAFLATVANAAVSPFGRTGCSLST